jgi:hypothetical protein
MFNKNNKLVAETLESRQLQANPSPLINKRDRLMINNKLPNFNKKLTATFRLYKKDYEKDFVLTGQNAKTLIALIEAKERGTTALEISCWALRLSAYIFCLRKDYSLSISTITEPHEGGNHGRYILHDYVEILEVFDPKAQANQLFAGRLSDA